MKSLTRVILLTALVMIAGPAFAAPTVSITQPGNGAWTGNSIHVVASASSNGGPALSALKLYGNGGVFFTQTCAGAACTADTSWTTGPLADGAYETNAVITDSAGTQVVSPTVTIYKNAKTPVYPSGATTGSPPPGTLTASFQQPANGATVCGTGVTVIMSSSGGSDPDNDGIVFRTWTLRIDGTVADSGTSRVPFNHQERTFIWDSTKVVDGAHAFYATVTDEAGHTAMAAITVNTRNALPLGLAITSPANGSTVKGSVDVALQSSRGFCTSRTFTFSVDGGPPASKTVLADTTSFPWDTTQVADGSHTLTATVDDGFGHTATASTTVNVANKSGGGATPTVTITRPGNGAWTGNSIHVIASASSGGAALRSIKLYGNGGVFFTQPCSATTCGVDTWWTTGSLSPGAYEINAVATTTTGAVGVSPTVTIYKDATTPVHPSGAPAAGGGGGTPSLTAWFGSPAEGATVSGTVEVTMNAGNAQGSPTSYLLKLDKTTTLSAQSVNGPTATYMWSTAGVPSGAHTLDLTVTDAASRTAAATVHVTVGTSGGGGGDTTPPTATITHPVNGDWTGNSIRVTAEATDNVGLATLKLYGDGVQFGDTNCAGATTCGCDNWWTTATLSTGQHTITAVATDMAGNQKTSAPVVINK